MLNRQELIEIQAVQYFKSEHNNRKVRELLIKERIVLRCCYTAGYSVVKRCMDVCVSSLVLLLILPVLLLVALLIRLESAGSVLFSQTRIGLNGRPFRFWKFRSMRFDAEQTKSQLMAKVMSNGIRFKLKKDPRITKVGAVIRKFSIDELPQLWNVLIGDMSLVGPRPALPSEVEAYTQSDKQRLGVMPGITCIWQVTGRSDIPFKQQVSLDVQYKLSQSVLHDIKLLLLTIPAVVLGKGAY
ncbi:MAG: sugar transferase [Methylococcales bacterium]|nr:sugar transferase [Methylococcales bacterium]